MISRSEAHRLVLDQDAGGLARAAFRAAKPPQDGSVGLAAAVGLNLATGKLELCTWREDGEAPESDDPIIVLAACTCDELERHHEQLSEDLDIPPSWEAVEEQLVQVAARQGINQWRMEQQLDTAYGRREVDEADKS